MKILVSSFRAHQKLAQLFSYTYYLYVVALLTKLGLNTLSQY